ncbi:hypothetical protein HPB51_006441 [Rhipicephalus microplus]|uniref:Uncharacterized protein n=1 Tax=Rhipicephalus microplus TaxID=6941 RepID=A0A9J6E7B4_RHIMP|nr:hypothetical protein HPB51_006441 [Rhipicephalus microplus]
MARGPTFTPMDRSRLTAPQVLLSSRRTRYQSRTRLGGAGKHASREQRSAAADCAVFEGRSVPARHQEVGGHHDSDRKPHHKTVPRARYGGGQTAGENQAETDHRRRGQANHRSRGGRAVPDCQRDQKRTGYIYVPLQSLS